MKAFELSRYIKKWLPLIVALCVGLTVASYLFLSSSRKYVASAVIHYNDASAELGQTPSGADLDVNEIKSSAILSRVLHKLSLEDTYSVDDLISRVTISEVVDADEEARKEALLDEGEEYEYEPTTYIVSFAADNSEGEAFSRQVLDEILDQYFAQYSEKYVNSATINNSLSKLYEDHYDYIEMMEIIDENISSAITALYQRINYQSAFRSSTTGLSFSDLVGRFELLQQVNVSELFSTIFENQITKDRELLVADYSTRIQNNDIENLASAEQLEDVVRLIDAYVEKMRESGNTNITYEYILDDVYGKDLTDGTGNLVGQGDQTVTYDELIFSWRDHSESREYAIIDSAYCSYIIDTFTKCTGACAAAEGQEPACAHASVTCSELNNPAYETLVAQTEQKIQVLVEELTELYDQVYATNDEYNEYQGAQSISVLSTVAVDADINVALYTALAAVFLLIVCCCGAVLLGRLNDIVQYIFYTDHMTGLNNRTAFDGYLKARDRRILDDGTVCASIAIHNQQDINRKFGRDAGDELIKFFARTLKEVFHKTEAYLVYNGNAQFFVITEKTDYVTVEYMLHRFRLLVDNREQLRDGEIRYEIGMAETYRDQVHQIRGLLSRAMSARKSYTAAPGPKTEKA